MPDNTKPETVAPAPLAAAVPPVTVVIQQQDRAGEAAQAMLDGKALQMDETVVGGKYSVNGVLVNANGEPVGTKLAANEALR